MTHAQHLAILERERFWLLAKLEAEQLLDFTLPRPEDSDPIIPADPAEPQPPHWAWAA